MRNLNRFFCCAALSAATLYQPSLADSHSEPSYIISSFTLSLKNNSEKCTLTVKKGEDSERHTTLLLNTPCYWVTAENSQTSEPLHYSYPKNEIDAALLVAGGELDWSDEKKTYHKLPIDKNCSQNLQGIIISENEVFAIGQLMEAPHCMGLAVDEKVFRQAADTEARYQETFAIESTTNAGADQKKSENKTVETTVSASETAGLNETENNSFLGTIQKTLKKLFTSED